MPRNKAVARNKSEAEPTIEGASDALMHVLRMVTLRMDDPDIKMPGDALYDALIPADKYFYTDIDIGVINDWAKDFKAWRKAKLALEEDKNATQSKRTGKALRTY